MGASRRMLLRAGITVGLVQLQLQRHQIPQLKPDVLECWVLLSSILKQLLEEGRGDSCASVDKGKVMCP